MSSIKEVSVEELHRIVSEDPDTMLLDVRHPDEYAMGHAPAVKLLIEHTAVAQSLDRLPDDLDTPIYVICRIGKRSAFAGEILAHHGYRKIYNVAGGTNAWRDAGYPLESGEGNLPDSD